VRPYRVLPMCCEDNDRLVVPARVPSLAFSRFCLWLVSCAPRIIRAAWWGISPGGCSKLLFRFAHPPIDISPLEMKTARHIPELL